MMSRPVAGTAAPDYFDCLVFNRPFAGSFTGRVNMNLREDKGYTYGARGRFSLALRKTAPTPFTQSKAGYDARQH